MAKKGTSILNLTPEQLKDIGVGIGAGFQSYDPNNPFAGAGAALSATLGVGMVREERRRQRQEKLEDVAAAKEMQIAKEQRDEEADVRAVRRRGDEAIRVQDEKRKADLAEEQRLRDMMRGMPFRTLGGETRMSNEQREAMNSFMRDFSQELPDVPRLGGSAPSDPYKIVMEVMQERFRRTAAPSRPSYSAKPSKDAT